MAGEITQAGLVARLRVRLSPHALAELDGLSGEEVLEIFGAMLERAGEMRRLKARARLLRDATGPVKATGTVDVTFTETQVGVATLVSGTVLFQTPWGVRFALNGSLVRSDAQAPGTVTRDVVAEWAGWDGVVRGRDVTEWAIPDLGNVDSLTGLSGAGSQFFIDGVAAGTITFAMSDTTGGRAGTLDVRARGLGMPRAEGEADATLRRRLLVAPDAISPNGIVRAVDAALGDEVSSLVEYGAWGFAWGSETLGGWGLHGWGRKKSFIVYVPAGSDLVAIRALVDRIRAAGYYGLVLEEV